MLARSRQAADTSAAEALAAKLNELFPEDTFQQKVLLPVTSLHHPASAGKSQGREWTYSLPSRSFRMSWIFYNRARAYMAAGDQAKAVADFQTVIRQPGLAGLGNI